MRLGALALVVLLAGCPAIGPQGAVTPAPTPEPAPEAVPYPPGLGPWGVGDAAGLAAAHQAAIDDTAYTLVSNRTIRTANGSLRSRLFLRVRLAADREYLTTVRTAGPDAPVLLGVPPASAQYWSNGTTMARVLTRDNRTRYARISPPDRFRATWRFWRSTAAFGGVGGFAYETVRSLFGDVGTGLVATSEADGARLYHLEAETVRNSDFAKVGSGPVRNLSLEATITERGLVRRFDLRYQRRVEGEWVTVTWHVAYEDVGSTTVERPPWFDRTGSRSGAQDDSPS